MVMMGHHSAAVICSVTALICCASAARAATLTVSNGEVLRSRGPGYESIKGSAEVIAGDTVFGKPGSAGRFSSRMAAQYLLKWAWCFGLAPNLRVHFRAPEGARRSPRALLEAGGPRLTRCLAAIGAQQPRLRSLRTVKRQPSRMQITPTMICWKSGSRPDSSVHCY